MLKKKLIMSSIFSSCTIIALLLTMILVYGTTSYGWFSSSTSASATGMGVSTRSEFFDLAVPSADRTSNSTITYYDGLLTSLGYDTDNNNGFETLTSKTAIKWVLTEETGNGKLAPGTYGSCTFSVVPRASGTITVHFDISLECYYAQFNYLEGKLNPRDFDSSTLVSLETLRTNAVNANNDTLAKEYSDAIKFAKGHILFYKNRTNDLLYSNRIDPEEGFNVTFNVTDQMVGQSLSPITIYWVWPNSISQIEYDNDSNHADLFSALFDSSQSVDDSGYTPRADLFNYISEHKDLFFSSVTIYAKTPSEIRNMLSLSNPDDIITLSNGYNNADQILGAKARLVLFSLSAIPAGQ